MLKYRQDELPRRLAHRSAGASPTFEVRAGWEQSSRFGKAATRSRLSAVVLTGCVPDPKPPQISKILNLACTVLVSRTSACALIHLMFLYYNG